MSNNTVPDNPSVEHMLNWIMTKYNMSLAGIARMFQTNKSTVHYWLKTGNISFRNLVKLRTSFYYLNNTVDPHLNERFCPRCNTWLPVKQFREGKAMCRSCEYRRVTSSGRKLEVT